MKPKRTPKGVLLYLLTDLQSALTVLAIPVLGAIALVNGYWIPGAVGVGLGVLLFLVIMFTGKNEVQQPASKHPKM